MRLYSLISYCRKFTTKEVIPMKKLIIGIMFVLLTAGVLFAEGGQNQGTTGSGTTSTGSDSQGSGSQSRSGR